MGLRSCALLVCFVVAAGPARAEPVHVLRKEAGNRYLKERRYEAARDQYLAALRHESGYADAHYNLGMVYFFRLRDYPRALYHLVAYAHAAPQAPDLDRVRALAFQALEHIEAAERADYERALRAGTPQSLEAFVRAHPLSPYVADAGDKLARLREDEQARKKRREAAGAAYAEAAAQGTPEALEAFLARFPDVPETARARALRDRLLEERRAAEAAFRQAMADGGEAALRRFLADYPHGPHSEEVRQRLAEVHARRAAEQRERAWEAAQSEDTAEAYRRFLETYPDAEQAARARSRLAEIEADAASRLPRSKKRALERYRRMLRREP
ncbi:MAG: hypothetical protein Kow0092_20260 [Deferrisomatales bacterium]